jgi:GNAT superfamily N-acetyltransferase
MSVDIRPVSLLGLTQLKTLFETALASDFDYFPASYHRAVLSQNRLRHFVRAWTKPHRLLLGVYQAGELVGYSITDCRGDEAFLFWVYLRPELRGQGIGRQLLAMTEKACSRSGSNRLQLATHRHHDYYAHQGFTQVKVVTESDAKVAMYIMEKPLNASV